MTAQIVEAFERTLPDVINPPRSEPPVWAGPLLASAEDWFGDRDIEHVEVAIVGEFPLDEGFQSATITVLTKEIVAQAVIEATLSKNITQAKFSDWKIVPLSSIIGVTWDSVRRARGGDRYNRLTATFSHLAAPLVVPRDEFDATSQETVKRLFLLCRDAWIRAGGSTIAAE